MRDWGAMMTKVDPVYLVVYDLGLGRVDGSQV